MANYCTFIPSKGEELFKGLKKQFGYKTARSIFLRAINPDFINDYRNTLTLDSEGVPTLNSVLGNSYMKQFIGDTRMIDSLESRYSIMEDTYDNYSTLIGDAYSFNTTSPQRDDYIASVAYTEDGKLRIKIQRKTEATISEFNNQYQSQKLNERLASIFKPLGISVGSLTEAEQKAGRVGVTDFSKVREFAVGFDSLIRIANNKEGAQALSEEFSHFIIGVFREEPLVERSIQSLVDHPESIREILGSDYEDVTNFYDGNMELVAEEALGHVLRRNLIKEDDIKSTPAPSLFRRFIKYIVNIFKGFKSDDIQDAISSADSSMSSLAKSILDGTKKITESQIKASQREAQFNDLSDRIERNIEILRDAAKVEVKRYKISKGDQNRSAAEQTVNEILSFTREDADTALGILNYANKALDQMRGLEIQFMNIASYTPAQKFSFLRSVKSYIQSYGHFLDQLNEAMNDELIEEDSMFLRNFTIEGDGVFTEDREVTLADILKELNTASAQLTSRFNKTALPAFAEFLKPFMGDNIVVPFGKYAGTTLSVEQLLKEAPSDISLLDRWLDSMADSSDVLLQLFDAAVKKARDNARLKTINDIQAINKLRMDFEKKGLTDFEWMFEKDSNGDKSGNYISPVNYGQFNTDREEFENYLTEKYGKNPTGEEAIAKIAERKAWYDEHAASSFGSPMPNPVKYRNRDYDNLSDTQKEFLERFLSIKSGADSKLPENRVARNKAIQIRKRGSQRIIDSLGSPSTIYENIKESISSSLLEREDDDQIFGENRAKKGMTDFAGNEFMTLPVLYTNRLKNPNELSTDVFGSLMSYVYMTNNYEQMDTIVDPLEIGKTLVTDTRKVRKTRGGNPIIEKFSALDVDVANKVFDSRTNIEKKLQDYLESQVYGRYLKDQGAVDVLGNKVNVNKFVGLLLKGSSLAQLGFNWLANIANVATGVGMQNIEAASREFFSAKELAKADWIYKSELLNYIPEVGSRVQNSKLALFGELFNIKQDYKNRVHSNQKKSLIERLFGADLAFIGQGAGDHWLYNRTAIAMALREQVLLDGKQMSLWDALQVNDKFEGNSEIKELNYRDIKNLDGSDYDIGKMSRRIAHVNQSMFGIYNDEDANAASRVAVGRLLQQYRKWMKAQYNKRFQANQYNVTMGQFEEGYYRTIGRMANNLVRGGIAISEQWDNMTDHEKANVRRAVTEMIQFFAVLALANLIEWPDDKNRPWALKLAEYSAKRLAHELGGLTPSPYMPQELLKTVSSPFPAASVIRNGFNLVNSIMDPRDWSNEIQSGPYEGLSTLEKNFIKAPIPGVAQFRQIDKFVSDIDTSIDFYARSY